MKTNIEKIIIAIGLPLVVGGVSSFLVGDSMIAFQNLEKPTWAPPGWIFPVVWSVLFVMMGVASYLILISGAEREEITKALKRYGVQLILNFFWSLIFFGGGWYLLAFIWIIILFLSIVRTIQVFYPISEMAAYLMMPYLLWVAYAGLLNLTLYFLN